MQQPARKNHHLLMAALLLFSASIAVMAIYFGIAQHRFKPEDVKINGIYLTVPQVVAPFHLTDNQGHDFTNGNFQGHWTMLFFGFTNCGMVCPTTMAALNEMYKTLQQELPDAQLPQVLMVSVDPERDTVQRMNAYVHAFNVHFMGARGTEVETTALENQLHIAAARMQVDGQGKDQYTINHTAEIMVINPKGQLQAFLSYPHHPAEMVADYKQVLRTPIS